MSDCPDYKQSLTMSYCLYETIASFCSCPSSRFYEKPCPWEGLPDNAVEPRQEDFEALLKVGGSD